MLKRRILSFLVIALLLSIPGMVVGAKEKGQPKAPPPKKGQSGPPKSGEELLDYIKDEVNQTPKDADVQLFKMVGDFLSKVKLPSASNKIFNKNLAMRNMKILTDIPKSYNFLATQSKGRIAAAYCYQAVHTSYLSPAVY